MTLLGQFWDNFDAIFGFLKLPGHWKGSRGSFFERRVPFVEFLVAKLSFVKSRAAQEHFGPTQKNLEESEPLVLGSLNIRL